MVCGIQDFGEREWLLRVALELWVRWVLVIFTKTTQLYPMGSKVSM